MQFFKQFYVQFSAQFSVKLSVQFFVQTRRALNTFITSSLLLVATSVVADPVLAPMRDRTQYDLACAHDNTEFLINSRTMNVAMHSPIDSDNYNYFETLLIDPIENCTECFMITVRSERDPSFIYEVAFTRAGKNSSQILVYAWYDDNTKGVMIPQTLCTRNPDFAGFAD